MALSYVKLTKYDVKEKCVLYDAKTNVFDEKVIAAGLYWNNLDFYCVWAKDKTLNQIEKTDRHEYCHYLVDNDYEHFCMGNNFKDIRKSDK